MWAVMNRKHKELSLHQTTKDSLFQKLSEIWNNLPYDYFKKLARQ